MKPRLPSFEQVGPYLQSMDQAQIYSNRGPLVRTLESRYATFLGVDVEQVATVSNATQGIMGAIAVSSKKRWVVPDWTFPATAHAVLNLGCEVVLTDVDSSTWAISNEWKNYQSLLGVLPVVPYGVPFMIGQYAMDQDFIVDAAASLGCQPNLSTLRGNGAVVFSLHATKVLGGGEGGIVVFGSHERAQEFRSWTNFGFAGTRLASRSGTNAKMSESTAAYCLAALYDWDNERESWLNSRREVIALSKRFNLNTWLLSEDVVSPYWLILCDSANERLALSECLSGNGVETRCWWPSSLHEMDAFASCDQSAIPPESTSSNLASRVVGLPFFRNIDKKSIEVIEESLRTYTTSR